MNRNRLYVAIFSIGMLVVLALSPLKDYFSEWRSYQHEYNDIIKSIPGDVTPTEIGIRQIWIRKMSKIDRCITCHLGLKEKGLANVKQPFKSHIAMYHDYENYGCTICHEGQGAATTYEEAAGKVKYWDKPLISGQYMESSCAKCHKESAVSQAPVLTMGRELIKGSNCVACHKINGYEKQWISALDGIAAKVNKNWLSNWLKAPKQYLPKTKMPNFGFNDREVGYLIEFLSAFKAFSDNAQFDRIPDQLKGDESKLQALVQFGNKKFSEARCISCHSVNGKGGYVSNDLGKVAGKVQIEWLYNYIKNPKRFQPGVLMPRFRFDEPSLTAVTAYIASEFADEKMKQISFNTTDTEAYAKGLDLFRNYNCGGCHQLSGISNGAEIGPELTFVGSKNLYEIEFGKSGVEQSLPSYLSTKLKNPRVFLEGLKMPDFSFTEQDTRIVATALLGNTSDELSDEYIVKNPSPPSFNPQGDFGKLINDLSCFGCHTMFGKGKLVATDLSFEASKTQRSWLEVYFKAPYAIRPIMTERMPNFYLTDSEIKIIVDYMGKVFVNDTLEREIVMNESQIEKGKSLYYTKYSCQSCHQIGSAGGYVGPLLDKTGLRLQPGWVFHWLKNPQSMVPETIEPNCNITNDEAEAITAYLMSLK